MTEQPMTRRQARELERLREMPGSVVKSEPSPENEPQFLDTDPNPISGSHQLLEPKSLLVSTPTPDLSNMSVVLPDSGSVLTTGAIELPWLREVDDDQDQLAAAAADADAALAAEGQENSVAGIQPIPARSYERTRRRSSMFPTRLRKGWGVVHLVLVSAFIIFALLSALVAAFMLGLIKF